MHLISTRQMVSVSPSTSMEKAYLFFSLCGFPVSTKTTRKLSNKVKWPQCLSGLQMCYFLVLLDTFTAVYLYNSIRCDLLEARL